MLFLDRHSNGASYHESAQWLLSSSADVGNSLPPSSAVMTNHGIAAPCTIGIGTTIGTSLVYKKRPKAEDLSQRRPSSATVSPCEATPSSKEPSTDQTHRSVAIVTPADGSVVAVQPETAQIPPLDGSGGGAVTNDDKEKPTAWIEKVDGIVRTLHDAETTFWRELIAKYLQPLQNDPEHQEKVGRELKDLRNKAALAFFLIDTLIIVFIYAMQSAIDQNPTLVVHWNCTLGGANETMTVDFISFMFMVVFGILLVIQFLCMFAHRLFSFVQIMASTEIIEEKHPTKEEVLQGAKDIIRFNAVNNEQVPTTMTPAAPDEAPNGHVDDVQPPADVTSTSLSFCQEFRRDDGLIRATCNAPSLGEKFNANLDWLNSVKGDEKLIQKLSSTLPARRSEQFNRTLRFLKAIDDAEAAAAAGGDPESRLSGSVASARDKRLQKRRPHLPSFSRVNRSGSVPLERLDEDGEPDPDYSFTPVISDRRPIVENTL